MGSIEFEVDKRKKARNRNLAGRETMRTNGAAFSKAGTVVFAVDGKLKRSLALRAVTSAPGGKAGLDITIFLAMLGILAPALVSAVGEQGAFATLNPHEDLSPFFSAVAFVVFAASAICVLIVTLATENGNLAMRRDERLVMLDGRLFYSFRCIQDNVHGLTEVLIDLRCTKASACDRYDEPRKAVFDAGTRWHHYDDARTEYRCPESEMEVSNRRFELYDYWKPSLMDALEL